MSRDPRKLRVFQLADSLVVEIYRSTKKFPADERYGLRAQMRRAAVSAAANIVEGCARKSTRDYLNFLNIAAGSAAETRYLLSLAARIGVLTPESIEGATERYTELLGGLVKLIQSLENES
jgi:four helix bundle protein